MNSADLQIIFQKYLDRTITDEEYKLLAEAAQEETETDWQNVLVPIIGNTVADEQYRAEDWEAIKEGILRQGRQHPAPVHRIHFLKTAWIRYAAAIIIIAGIGTAVYLNNQKEKPSVTQNNPVPVQNDVAPGGNRATLTLADGSKIILDSVANGKLADQGKTRIEKKGDRIVYSSAVSRVPSANAPIAYNTMSTPRGGQYQLTLPDGSQVWLNAESSITYPTAFTGNDRKVTISGEAYFEVAKDKAKPFKVDIGEATIEVLGTHFNVNTYKDEPSAHMTLLEGSVQIKTVHTSLTLQPGQQGQFDQKTKNLSLAVNPDVEQVMSWKNGLFNFNNLSLEQAMTQLARWYDVEVVYEGTMPKVIFGGKIGRDLRLSQVLKGLQMLGIHYRIEGNKLIITA